MNGNVSTAEPSDKKASKLAKQVLKYIDCYKCKRQMNTCCVLKKHKKNKLWKEAEFLRKKFDLFAQVSL